MHLLTNYLSADGDAWSRTYLGQPQLNLTNHSADFTHDMARSRAFRWGEDGIAGVCDSHGLQNVAFAFWNEKEYVHSAVGCL
jgi:hypothetical protein